MSQQFTKAIDLIFLAKQNGIDIALNEDQLQLKLPKNKAVDKNLIDQIKSNKQIIVDFLKDHAKPGQNLHPITRFDRSALQQIPLSFSQERLWFIDQMEGSIQYHIPAVLRLRGELDRPALENALHHIVDRHEVLRTVLLEQDGIPYQVIRDSTEWQLSVVDGSLHSDDEKELHQLFEQLISKPFDLSRDYMMRAHLLNLGKDDHVLVVVTHHIASDGWSSSILVREVIELYSAYHDPVLLPLPIQYADYAVWQRNFLQGDVLNRKLDYWKQKLTGVTALQLPADHPRPPVWTARGSSREFRIDKHLSDRLVALSQQNGCTLYMTLLAAFNILLYRYSGQQDICVGSPIANRTQQEVEGLIGFFINTLALRNEVDGQSRFTGLLQQVKQTTMEAYEHQDVPFEKIVEVIVKDRDLSRNPLFQVMFALQNTPENPKFQLGDIELSPIKLLHTVTKFDITFLLVETPQGIRGDFQYARDLYNEQTIIRMMDHYRQLLSSIVESPDKKIDEIVMLPDQEKQTLLADFNNTRVDYAGGKTMVDLFEEQVVRTPGAIAVVFDEGRLTYQELNERANQVAHYLTQKGVRKESLVAICLERGMGMVAGILGILKSGAAYVPIDPEYPAERIGYMVEDSAASIVLSSSTAREKIPTLEGIEVIELEDDEAISSRPRHDLKTTIEANQLAYVIYTSGSTGKPKGVMIEHHNMFSFISWCRDEFSSSRFDIVYASTSICFDLSIFEIFYPLSIGKTIRILESAMQIERYLENDSFVLVNTVPVVIENLLNQGVGLSNVSVLNMAGEPVPTTVLQRLDTDGSEVRNLYGPTEDTTYSTVFRLRKDRPVLIGKPISNTKIYILDKNKQLTPIGVPGEICIAGEGVARGYLNRAELTAEKFIDDPISTNTTSKIYRTGDLGRWLQDGNIEYLGRIDQQVKIRGYRIELGEIEAVIHESGLVQQAVVISKKDPSGSNQLVGYIVAKGQFNQDDLISTLREKLPQYMIPASWVSLPTLPLTPNGKIDKKALPDPESGEGTHEYVAPGNEVERTLAKIWQDVLSIPVVGVNDNFFEIGGHSLKAMRLISSIRKELGSELSIKELFTYPTIKGLASCLASVRNDMLMPPVEARPRPDFIPLSFSQERLWFIDQMEGSIQYHIPAVLRLRGELDRPALENALHHIVDRHEVLRTVLLEQDGIPYQVIRDSTEWQLSVVDGSLHSDDEKELHQLFEQLISKPFDLSRDYMMRAHLLNLGKDDHVLVVVTHHIASDGWSSTILVREVIELYSAYHDPVLLPLPIQYADYAVWQRNFLQGDVLNRKLDYWKQKLTGVTALQLPADHPRPPVWTARGSSREFRIDKHLSDRLVALSQQNGCTLYMTLLAAFNILLYRYSGQQDICVGSPIANRTQQEVEGLIGFFINTLALRNEVDGQSRFTGLLQQVKQTTMEAYEHQDVPFEKIVEVIVKDRDLSRNPLFQVMFALQNTPENPKFQLGDIELSPIKLPHTVTKFDITFLLVETPQGIRGDFQYARDLYNEQTIIRMMDHYRQLLSSIVESPDKKIDEIVMLPDQEKQTLLGDFNNTRVDYAGGKTMVDLFEEQVVRTPQAIAVVFDEARLTYQELNERANQVAHYLTDKGVRKESLVAICLERGPGMVAAILGILKSGAAYVPIDPEYPAERIGYMLEDSAASIVLSSSTAREKIPTLEGIEVIELEDDEAISSRPRHDLKTTIEANQLAYVIYTSGSTGKPKGVMIEHHNMFSFISWCRDEFSSSRFDIVYASTSICFDLSIFEIFYPLSIGKTIRILESAMQIERYLENDSFVLVNTVPVVIENLLNQGVGLSNVSVLNMAGEPVPTTVLQRLDTDGSEVRNLYGPTEDTTYSTVFRLRKDRPVLIGKPISNTKIYILDKNKQLTPIGVPGEICIAGEGVARGYLNRAELTAEKFIDDPISTNTTSKIYRTGDLGRWLQDGNIEYLGRIDQQVKIRGYRIELGEIEAVIHESGLVQQAVVISKKDPSGSNQLVGYIVAKGQFNQDDLISTLREKLPQYMIPASWVSLPTLPLTPNGKIDKKALPDPESGEGTHEYVAPGNEVERTLAKIWQDVLSIPVVGVNDNFFEIGGHSLKAMRLISSIRKELGSELSIKELFTYPTIKGLASCLASVRNDMLMPPVEARPRPDFIPLSFSQERLWFIDRLEGSKHYHIPAVLKLKGQLNTEALSSALQQIVNRHEVLRTVIREEEGNPYQHVLAENGFRLSIMPRQQDQDNRGLKKLIDELINQPFDLANDHMLRATLITLNTDEHVLVATMHHIASDAWSIPIVLKEVMEFYTANQRNTLVALPELEVQYADYAIWQRENLEGDALSRKLEYWKKSLQGITPLQMPLDFPRPAIQSTRGANVGFRLDKDLSNALQHLSQQRETTLFMTMLASFNVLLHRYSQQQNICIGTPIAGRQQQELEALVGFFVNTLALHTEINGKLSFLDFLDNVKDTVLNGYMHQDVPFEKVVEAVVKERNMSFTPLFQVMFILQNAPEISKLDFADLEVSHDSFSWNTSKFDLTFSLVNTTEGLVGSVEYSVDLFSEETIKRMIEHFQNLLSAIVQDPGQKIGVIRMLNEKEEYLLTHHFNDTKVTFPAEKSIADLFEDQAEKTPDHIAVVFGKRQLTYRELNEKSNQFAHYLLSNGVNPQSLVPICLERGVELIICVLGILKTGCAYVPIDPQDPDERIYFKFDDTGATMVVGSKTVASRIQSQSNSVIFDVDEDWSAINDFPVTNPNIKIGPYDLAYVIYTSGSTGQPKAVKMQGSALVNLLLWQEKEFKARNRRVLQFASINFDVSFQEIFSTLCFGSTLFLISEDDRRDPGKMLDHLKDYRITHLFLPYIMLKNLAEYVLSIPHVTLSLEEIIVAGEQLKITDDIRAVLTESNIQLVNQYGPSESHVVSSFRVEKNNVMILPPIGKPIDNTRLYILNDSMSLVPVGITGELYIGGVQVSQGYLNRPELTAERFIPDPFSLDHKARLYKTGDLTKWMADGNIEYLGRADDQVKIRGYRVEIGEIESVLQQYHAIRQGVVLAKEDLTGNKRLVGFVVPENAFDPVAIMSYLKERLPDYMVPTQWVEMKSLPVNVNGKVDRKALPEPEELFTNREYSPPANEMEEKLAEIWRKLLAVEVVGRNDNFFDIGGHSLLAMRLIAAVRRHTGVDLPLIDIYNSDIQSLAAKINRERHANQLGAPAPYIDAGSNVDLDEALAMADRMEKGLVEWGANGHGKYLVPIKSKGTKNPFFGIISFNQYRRLGSLMPDDQPLFYLPPTRSASVEEIASHYIKEMKLSHPGGPYTIGGFCGSGMIALEIAQQLQAQGDKVSALVLFEYYAPDSMIRRKSVRYKKRLIEYYKTRLGAYKNAGYSGLDVVKFLAKKGYRRIKDFINPPPPKFITAPEYGRYKHKPYSGKVILFQASVRPLEATDSPLMGWSKYFSGEVQLITVQGGHLGIFKSPAITKLAQELTTVLNELNTQEGKIQKSLS